MLQIISFLYDIDSAGIIEANQRNNVPLEYFLLLPINSLSSRSIAESFDLFERLPTLMI